MRKLFPVILLGLIASHSSADVTDADRVGFTTVNEVVVNAEKDAVWQAAIEDVGLNESIAVVGR